MHAAIENAFDAAIGNQFAAYYSKLSGGEYKSALTREHTRGFKLIFQTREDLLSLVDQIYP